MTRIRVLAMRRMRSGTAVMRDHFCGPRNKWAIVRILLQLMRK
jgi:hypothetical protein